MNKEEFLKAIENVPKIDSINPISAYNSINVEDRNKTELKLIFWN